ncbi:hypothetical protein N7526_011051 [Penicillium atrosanguineum]|nr:hypothetical protein N7526_011051 [Penicillium atrosanguineum]
MDILVHVSAPSSISDDARYRVQAAAIRAMMQPTAGSEGQAQVQVESVAAVPCLPADPFAPEPETQAIAAEAPTQIGNSISSLDHSLDSIISVIPDSQPTQAPLQREDPEPLDPLLPPPSKRRRSESKSMSKFYPAPQSPRAHTQTTPCSLNYP